MRSEQPTRRGFFGTLGGVATGAFVMLKTGNGEEVKAVSDPKELSLITAPSGQLVDDIIIGAFCLPRDVSYLIDFRRSGNPEVSQLQVTLNARATFRWVAAPNREIRLGPGERLTWKIVCAGGESEEELGVVVHTRGQCLATGRVVINQSEFA